MLAHRPLSSALVLGLLSASVMALRIAGWHEAWNERTFTLLAIALLAGFGAAILIRLCLGLVERLFGVMRERLVVFLLFPFCYVGSMAVLLELQNQLISGKFDDEMIYSTRMVAFSLVIRYAFNLAFLPNYLLPLVLPIVTAAAILLMARRHSTKT